MIVKWSCPDCGEVNESDYDDVQLNCQTCKGCENEYAIYTDDLAVIAKDIQKMDEE